MAAPTFPEVLNDLRQAAHMSAAELARAAKVPDSTVSRWLSGKTTPSIHAIEQLAALFTVDRDYLERLAGYRANRDAEPSGGPHIGAETQALLDSTAGHIRVLIDSLEPAFASIILLHVRVAADLARQTVNQARAEAVISSSPEPRLARRPKGRSKLDGGPPSAGNRRLAECYPQVA